MPLAPATPTILTAIQTKAQSAISPTYMPTTSVIVGTFPDPTAEAPCLEIYATDDDTKRLVLGNGIVQGAKVDDGQMFFLELTIPANDRQAAEVTLAQIRDALTAAFHASATLNTAGVQYAGLTGKGKRGFINRAGQQWRIARWELLVKYQYSVTVVP